MSHGVNGHGITRRKLLKAGAAGTLAVGLGPLLSACSAGPKTTSLRAYQSGV